MNVLQKLALWTAQKAGEYGGFSFSLSDTGAQTHQKLSTFWGAGTYTGKAVTDQSAMSVTVVWACVRLLAETMGAMPSAVFRQEKNGNAVKADDHRLHEVLVHTPNSEMNGLEFREARTSNLALRGNQCAVIERGGDGNVSSLYPVPMQRKRDASTDWKIKYGVTDRGKTEWYPADKIWHTRGFSFNGLEGLSPIGYAREAMGLALAGEEFNARLFGQGLRPSAIVSIPQFLTSEQRVTANAKLLEMHTGLQNLNKPMLMEGGMKVESGLITPDDAQFLQLRQFTVVELCRLFGVKPHMIAALERATDNNIEKLSLEFVMYTMLPYLRREEEGARQLFKPADRGKFFYRYNFEGLLRADSVARAQLYSILLQNGIFSRNEVRALENRNQVDDPAMNEFTVQSNMAMIDQLAALVAAREAAPGAVPAPAKSFLDSLSVNVRSFGNEKDLQNLDVLTARISGLDARIERIVKQSDGANAENAKQLKAIAENMRIGLADVKAQARKPRKPVYNAKGDVIGVEIVDTLH